MKYASCLLSLAFLFVGRLSADTVSFAFANNSNAGLTFIGTGDTFDFENDLSGRGFHVTSTSLSHLLDLEGTISGTFQIGAISTFNFPGLSYDEAPVSGTGLFAIYDSLNQPLTASVTWNSVLRVFTTGSLNPDGQFNLSNFTYAGSDPQLAWLASSTTGSTTVSFQFLPSKTLAQLTADGAVNTTSYSGSATAAVPEPSVFAILLGAAALLVTATVRPERFLR